MSIKKILVSVMLLSATFAQAQEARVTDETSLAHILGAHAVAQQGPLAASLIAGKANKVTAITVKQSKSKIGQGCDLSFVVESELQIASSRSELNAMCLPDSIFKGMECGEDFVGCLPKFTT